MLNRNTGILLLAGLVCFTFSCSPRNISTKYYYQNEKVLDGIEKEYKDLYRKKPFKLSFNDRSFNTVSVEIITDTITYIYEFAVNEPRLADSLVKYQLDAPRVMNLIRKMQSIRCAWISSVDYYTDEKKDSLVYLSIKPVALKAPFSYSRYYVLTYFHKPQYFDKEGRLLDKRRVRRLRKINGEIFRRINDKVCYTISGRFR